MLEIRRAIIGADQSLDKLLDGAFRLRALETIDRTAILECIDHRDRLHAQLSGNRRMLVDIDFDQAHLAALRLHDFLDHRRQLLARPAPGRPAIQQHRHLLRQGEHAGFEIGVVVGGVKIKNGLASRDEPGRAQKFLASEPQPNSTVNGSSLDDDARAELEEIIALLKEVRKDDPGFAKAREAYIRAEKSLKAADDASEGTLLPKGTKVSSRKRSRNVAKGVSNTSPDDPLERLDRLLKS